MVDSAVFKLLFKQFISNFPAFYATLRNHFIKYHLYLDLHRIIESHEIYGAILALFHYTDLYVD